MDSLYSKLNKLGACSLNPNGKREGVDEEYIVVLENGYKVIIERGESTYGGYFGKFQLLVVKDNVTVRDLEGFLLPKDVLRIVKEYKGRER